MRSAWLLVGLSWAGCAPVASMRPPPQLEPGRDAFAGAAVVAETPRPWVDEPWRASAQTWGGGRVSDRVELATVVAFDDRGASAGVALRWTVLEADRASLALEVSGGWLWVAVSVPASARLFGGTRLYAAPRLGTWGAEWSPAMPVGLSVGLPEDVALRLEAQWSWPGLVAEGRRLHLAAGVAGQL